MLKKIQANLVQSIKAYKEPINFKKSANDVMF
jgi:hypothetical protein